MVITHKIAFEYSRIMTNRNPRNTVEVDIRSKFKSGCFAFNRNSNQTRFFRQ